MILSDGEILELLKAGCLKITPFNKENLTPNGYDLSVDGIEQNGLMVEPQRIKDVEFFLIPPLESFRAVTVETVELPLNIVGSLWLKTKFTRKGIQATFGKVEAGFHGTLALGLFNGSGGIFNLNRTQKICQIVFEQMSKPALKGYVERSGNYQHQKKTVLK